MTLESQEMTFVHMNWRFIVSREDVTAFADEMLRWQHEVSLPKDFSKEQAIAAVLDVAPHTLFKYDREDIAALAAQEPVRGREE